MNELLLFNSDIKSRREFLRRLTLGTAGLSAGLFSGCAAGLKRAPRLNRSSKQELDNSRVSLVKGTDRRDMIVDALQPFESHLKEAIGDKQVIIKINMVSDSKPLCATPPDAVRGVLDFLKPIYDRPVIIAESSASNKGTYYTFEEYGFLPVVNEYNAKLAELNNEPTTYHWILDENIHPVQIRIINTFLDPNNYIISVTRLKTHNNVIATLSLKNIVMGSPVKIGNQNDKVKMHGIGNWQQTPSNKILNHNIFLMAHRVRPDFCVLDGFEGMEGSGPSNGTPVDHKIALAGPDFVSVDRIGSELMGIPWEDIGYLQFCANAGLGQGDRSKINIIGENPSNHVIKYKLHENIESQYKWKDILDIP
ncbi:DUF362 domain-containing protein [Candidatus Latescibacterota bacterium]